MSDFFYIDLDSLQDYFSQELVNPSFDKEDALNLEADDVGSLESVRRIEAFKSRFFFNGATNALQNTELSKTMIDTLYGEVSGKPQNKSCLTALLVHFAVKNTLGQDEFILVFEPVFLKMIGYDSSSLTYRYRIDSTSTGSSYYVNNGSLTICNTYANNWRENYKNPIISINRHKNASKPAIDFIQTVDTESHLFPFQLIYTLLKDNNTNRISFINCMSEQINNINFYYKQSLMLFAPPQAGGSGDFYGKYANRSHLCPPCTDEFGFLLDLENV